MSRWLPAKVSDLLKKARESATLAVDIYNKPRTDFRSGGFIVLMCIAWVSLIHAIFEREWKKYFHKKWKSYIKIDWDKKAWELEKSALEHFWSSDPRYKNIEFFVRLRNKIEHRFMPNIDDSLVGECQALLLNFESLLTKEFWDRYSLVEQLFIPLQFTRKKRVILKDDEKRTLEFIKQFRESIDLNISGSQEFSFKMFMIPKLWNHRNSSDVAVEFIKFDPSSLEDMQKYEKLLIGIKEKPVPVANQWKYRPRKILEIIQDRTGIQKNLSWHTSMWKKYSVRPVKLASNPKQCDVKYCQFDEAATNKDYVYTDEWIEFLIQEEINKAS